MPNPALIVHVDAAAVLGALQRFPAVVEAHLKVSFKETADAIQREAQGRIRRRTGKTGDAIEVQESYDKKGYVVVVAAPRTHIGRWLEWGTVNDNGSLRMAAKPFLFISAQLEEGPGVRRAEEALQAAIEEIGLGDKAA